MRITALEIAELFYLYFDKFGFKAKFTVPNRWMQKVPALGIHF